MISRGHRAIAIELLRADFKRFPNKMNKRHDFKERKVQLSIFPVQQQTPRKKLTYIRRRMLLNIE